MARVPDTKRRRSPEKKIKGKRSGKQIAWLVTKILLISILAAILLVVGYVAWILNTTDFSLGDSMSMLNMDLTSIVYCQNPDTGEWEEYEYLSSESNRIWVDIDVIPNYLEDAFIAIEDQRFMQHHGVDWKRTIGATFNEFFGGGSSYGGSSITQQLVKNMTGEKDRSYDRKIKEIARAISLEKKMSKQQILELYLNSIYLGQGCYGVESASQVYFSKSVNELTLAEAASIAGITQLPSLYDPFINPDKNIEKQRRVLGKMLELGYISQAEYDEAVAEELNFVRGEVHRGGSQSYFVDQVVEDVIADLCEVYDCSEAIATQMVYGGGLKIYTTVDRKIQDTAEEVFKNDANYPTVKGDEQPQASIVVMDPSTGHIKAIVGGRGEKNISRSLNRATQTTRQPGSTIKPLAVYAPAIDMGIITPDSRVEDAPLNINGWSPKNYYNSFYGNITVRYAVEQSANTPAVRVLQKLTVDNSFEYMTQKLNFTTLVSERKQGSKTFTDKALAALALGGLTDGVTVREMTAAYAAFANNGEYIESITYTHVVDNAGKTVLSKTPKKITAFSPSTAYQMNQVLNGVVTNGTGRGAAIAGMTTAAKTGTTDGDTDRWFAGYTPYYAAVVWVGMDSSKAMPSFSKNPALTLWKKVMDDIHKELPNKTFERPSNMVSVRVCYATGLLATSECYDENGESTAVIRYYDGKNRPKVYCSGDHGVKPGEETTEEGQTDESSTSESEDDPNASTENNGSSTPPASTSPQKPDTPDTPSTAEKPDNSSAQSSATANSESTSTE